MECSGSTEHSKELLEFTTHTQKVLLMKLTRSSLAVTLLLAAIGCSSSNSDGLSLVPQTATPIEATSKPAGHKSIESQNKARVNALSEDRIPDAKGRRVSEKFPDVELLDQNGKQHHFYSDLVKDHPVCIVFFYTRCQGSCPGTTQAMKKLRTLLAPEFGSEMRFISLTLDPEVDSSEELREYMQSWKIEDSEPGQPEWYYCTGKYEELEELRRSLGLYELDPVIDADRTQHAAILTFGNDRTNRWAALPVGSDRKDIVQTMTRIAGNTQRQRYASAVKLGLTAHGHLVEE